MPLDYEMLQRFGAQPSFAEKFAQNYAAMGERQNRLAQLAQQQEMQGYQMRGLQRAEERAPIEQQRADLAYQQQQSEALRRQQEGEQLQGYMAGLPPEEQLAVKMAPKEYFGAKFYKPKPEDVLGEKKLGLEKEKFAWEKGQEGKKESWQTVPTDQGIVQVNPKTGQIRPLGIKPPIKSKAGEYNPIYDTASNEWVYPPSEEFPQGRRTGDVAKLNAVTAAKSIIDEFKSGVTGKEKSGVLYQAPSGGVLGLKGTVGRVTDTQKAREFDNLRESLSTQMRAVFRIPGEGALSDKEQAQYGLQLPDVKNDPDVNERILNRLGSTLGIRASSTEINKPNSPNEIVHPQYPGFSIAR